MSLGSLFQWVSIALGTWLSWKALRLFFVKHPLAHISGPQSNSWIAGTILPMLEPLTRAAHLDELVKKHGSTFMFRGLFGAYCIHTNDPKALHHLIVKDRDIFEESVDLLLTSSLVFGKSLLATVGDEHRKQRKSMNPVFTAAYLREMVPTFYQVGNKAQNSFLKLVEDGEQEIDVLPWATRIALEAMAQSGFGHSIDTLDVDAPEHPFARSLKRLTGVLSDPVFAPIRIFLLPYVYNIGTPRFRRAVVEMTPWKAIQDVKEMSDILHSTATDILQSTRKALEDLDPEVQAARVGGGKDIMSVLVKSNNKASKEDKMTDDELIAHISTLTFAAMDTTSNAICRILHLLSENREVQTKLREEVRAAYADHGGEMDYDAISSLPYLDAVIRESLRCYAPLPMLLREARQDGVIQLHRPVLDKDGKEVYELHIPKDTLILVSLHHCNRDPDIWGPDAAEWKPERWINPLPSSVTEARIPGVYSNLMTFLGGGRSCIGFKFAVLELKIMLSLLIEKLQFSPSGKKVVWVANGINQPTIEDPETMKPSKKLQFSLKVSLASQD